MLVWFNMLRDARDMAAIFWIILGIIIGILLPLFYFGTRNRREAEQLEQEWSERLRNAEHKTAKEIGAHEKTKSLLASLKTECAECQRALEALQQAPAADTTSSDDTATKEALAEAAAAQARIAELEAELDKQRAANSAKSAAPSAPAPAPQPAVSAAPATQGSDKLTRIKGIGPVIEKKLHNLGITTFAQIAAFTEEDVSRVNGVLDFPGRIEREDWISQAEAFASEQS